MAGKLLIKLSARRLFRESQLAQAPCRVCVSDVRIGKPCFVRTLEYGSEISTVLVMYTNENCSFSIYY